MYDGNRCVCCGRLIPEGAEAPGKPALGPVFSDGRAVGPAGSARQVCKKCEQAVCLHAWAFDRLGTVNGKRVYHMVCANCGARRTAIPVSRIQMECEDQKYSGLIEED